MTDTGTALAAIVRAEFRRRMQGEYLPRIRRCAELLGEQRVWERRAPNVNAVGNLVLHLCGNVTQWILATFGRAEDRRDRPAEFAARGGLSVVQLMAQLQRVVDEACACVDSLTVSDLLREHTIQQRYRETGLSAVLHVLEHFAGHAGQIFYFTKQATGLDLQFYDL